MVTNGNLPTAARASRNNPLDYNDLYYQSNLILLRLLAAVFP
ncbi:MAG: hypothetical protein ACFFDT_35530 [Candidatus Hodarchaeota archaeon]